jgi:excisionase family DNA binding protein
MQQVKQPRMLTIAETAVRLHVSAPTVRRLIRDAGLPAKKLGTSHSSSVRIDPVELDAWLCRSEVGGAA